MSWRKYKDSFEEDGSYRDIYILNTMLEDWHYLYQWLVHHSPYALQLTLGRDELSLLENVSDIFSYFDDEGNLLTLTLRIYLGKCVVNTHFFTEEEIEFDLSPHEINDMETLQQIFDFMTAIGDLLQRDVILTPENTSDVWLFKYDHTNQKLSYKYD